MTRDQLKKLERDLWAAADKLRANSDLKASEYSTPVLGLIFLKFADNKYRQHEAAIQQEYKKHKGKRTEKSLEEVAVEKCGFFLQDYARYDYLLQLPEKENIAKLLVQDWFKDRQSMQQVRSEIERVLDEALPESYDRTTFKQKCDNVFDLAIDYANHHRRWAA